MCVYRQRERERKRNAKRIHTDNNFLYRDNRLMRSAVELQLDNIQTISMISLLTTTTSATANEAVCLCVLCKT